MLASPSKIILRLVSSLCKMAKLEVCTLGLGDELVGKRMLKWVGCTLIKYIVHCTFQLFNL